ncbi:MAG: beta-lactamase family protein [Gemmatimonadales bacterium]|nr:beta-lactamase family protein [Gemmatimonadales bacterium]
MTTRIVVAAAALLACAPRGAGPSSDAATPAAPAAQQVVSAVRQFITDTLRALGAPGAAICVVQDGRTAWSAGIGMADLEQRVPVTTTTKFRVGSVSKALTAVALGRLHEMGRLDWDAPVQSYVPAFPVKRFPITVRQLAGHLAGIRHYQPGEFENQKHYATVTEGLTIFARDSLLFEPGTEFGYSSYGYNLLSAVIEGASGEPYLKFMTEQVFKPAGMVHTVAEQMDSIIPERGRYYTRSDSTGLVVNAPFVDNSYKWASGGFLSTAEDLARFGQQLLEGRILRPETLDLLWTSMRTADGQVTDYGIGWSVESDSLGRRRVRHSGGSVGGTAHLIIYPDHALVVAVLVNSDYTFTGALSRYAEPFLRR